MPSLARALAVAPVLRPLLAHLLQPALEEHDASLGKAAVGLELGLAGATGADATAESLQVAPLAGEAR